MTSHVRSAAGGPLHRARINLAQLILSTAAVAFFFAFSGGSAVGQTIKFAHVDPADWTTSKKGAAGKVFKDLVEAESAGKMKVELYPAGQLGGGGAGAELQEGGPQGLDQLVLVVLGRSRHG